MKSQAALLKKIFSEVDLLQPESLLLLQEKVKAKLAFCSNEITKRLFCLTSLANTPQWFLSQSGPTSLSYQFPLPHTPELQTWRDLAVCARSGKEL